MRIKFYQDDRNEYFFRNHEEGVVVSKFDRECSDARTLYSDSTARRIGDILAQKIGWSLL